MPEPRLRLNVKDATSQNNRPVPEPESKFDVIVTFDETSGDVQFTKTPGQGAWDDRQGLTGLRTEINRDNRTHRVLIKKFHRFLETNSDEWIDLIQYNLYHGQVYWTAEIPMDAFQRFQNDERIGPWLSTWARIDRHGKEDRPNDGIVKVLIVVRAVVAVAIVFVCTTVMFSTGSYAWTIITVVLLAARDFVRFHLAGVFENLIANFLERLIYWILALLLAGFAGGIIREVRRWFKGRKGRNTNGQRM